ncbi:MAG TPA: hypothetical protein VLA56_09050 [Pseudomonadales bacterium]|nr:hypothetical protein [Pseudomonadales bacterium]
MSGSGFDGAARERLRRVVRAETRRPAQAPVLALVDALRDKFGTGFEGALYYGSCRRQDMPEGLIDLHVLVDDPVRALGALSGRLCAWLPPNVYYLEVEHEGQKVRCKYAVLSLQRFRRLCTRRAFHSYFWARYAQPLSVLGVEGEARRAIEESLVDAHVTLFSRALPRFTDVEDPLVLWESILALCYRCELRPESGGRAASLIEGQPQHFRSTGRVALDARSAVLANGTPELSAAAWMVRIAWGKVVSLLRLLKALQTFDGGLDYAAWKLERHTGRHIEIPDRVRRHPWLYLWPHLYRLWREGTFR